jgi:hypothetical protein
MSTLDRFKVIDLYTMAPSRVAIAAQHLHNNVRAGSMLNYVVPQGLDMKAVASALSAAIDQPNHVIPYDELVTPDPELLDMAGDEPSILVMPLRNDASQAVMVRLTQALYGESLRAKHTVIFISESTEEKPKGYFDGVLITRMVSFGYCPEEIAA